MYMYIYTHIYIHIHIYISPYRPPLAGFWASLVAQMVKNLSAMQEAWVQSLDWEDALEKGMATSQVFLPGEFHGQRSLKSCSPQGHQESDTTD